MSSAPSVPDAVITVRTHVAACLTLVRFVDDASYRIGHSAPADGVSFMRILRRPLSKLSLKLLALDLCVLLSSELMGCRM